MEEDFRLFPFTTSKFHPGSIQKVWQIEQNTELDTFEWSSKGTPLKSGPRAARDTAISAYPWAKNGYNDYFDLTTNSANALTGTRIERFDTKKTIFSIRNGMDLI